MQKMILKSAILAAALGLAHGVNAQESSNSKVLGVISAKSGIIKESPASVAKNDVTPSQKTKEAQEQSPPHELTTKTLKLVPIPAAPNEPLAVIPPPAPKRPDAQNMPGLGMMPGESPEIKNKIVRTGTERNEIVYISAQYPNRISTPFADPEVIDRSGSDIQISGQDIYFTPAGSAPVAIFIKDAKTRQTISLTLVPKNIPSQTLVAQLDSQSPSTENDAIPSDYLGKINSLLKQVAQDKIPAGFTTGRLPSTAVRNGDMVMIPLTRYSGASFDIYKYQLKSAGKVALELKEESFYNDENIRAIAFSPTTILHPGDETYMYVLSDRAKKDGRDK